jgi:hypothetical protein
MGLAMILSPIWYLSPVFIGGFLALCYYGKNRKDLIPALLIWGEISSVAAWYGSPWLAWMVQSSVIAIFLLKIHTPDSRDERKSLIILCGIFAMIIFFTDMANHTLVPVLLVIGSSLLVLLYIHAKEFRLRKKYSGERS